MLICLPEHFADGDMFDSMEERRTTNNE